MSMQQRDVSSSAWSETFPPAPKWATEDIPDLAGKVCAVTGGYGGIGYEISKALLQHGAKVYILGRSQSKFDDCILRLASVVPSRPHFIPCDLASLSSSKSAARHLLSLEPTLHVLYCSAGVAWSFDDPKTSDGFELTFQSNVMGHFILFDLLKAALVKAYTETGIRSRVVCLSSFGLNTAPKGGLQFGSLKADEKGLVGGSLNKQELYGQSKLAMVLLAKEIQRRYGDHIIGISLNPGNIQTGLTRSIHSEGWRLASWVVGFIERYLCYSPEYGALTPLYAGTSPEVESLAGGYLRPWARAGTPGRIECEDQELSRKLWDWLRFECQSERLD